jgi:hypothetical protein
MTVELFKVVFFTQKPEPATMYYPEFSPQSQWDLQEVNEERVS